jgi:hypothetical protein
MMLSGLNPNLRTVLSAVVRSSELMLLSLRGTLVTCRKNLIQLVCLWAEKPRSMTPNSPRPFIIEMHTKDSSEHVQKIRGQLPFGFRNAWAAATVPHDLLSAALPVSHCDRAQKQNN